MTNYSRSFDEQKTSNTCIFCKTVFSPFIVVFGCLLFKNTLNAVLILL